MLWPHCKLMHLLFVSAAELLQFEHPCEQLCHPSKG